MKNRLILLSQEYKISNVTVLLVFLATVLILRIMSIITGLIAVNNGLGWDGAVYLNHVQTIASGHMVENDPYRLVRMGAFIPAIITSALTGWGEDTLVVVQLWFNIITLALSTVFFFNFLIKLGVTQKVALLSTATMIFSWSFLVIPVFYPILTDYFALFMVCMALWLWSCGKNFWIFCLGIFSWVVMPGIFIVTFFLLAMPVAQTKTPGHDQSLICPEKVTIAHVLVFITLLIMVSLYLVNAMILIPDNYIFSTIGFVKLRVISMICVVLSISVIIWILTNLLFSNATYRSMTLKSFFWGTLSVAIGFLMIYFFVDWSRGFTGPPLLENMLIQSLAAPAQSLIAHFMYFGPVFIMAIARLFFNKASQNSVPLPMLVIFLVFLPLLVLGSESRQWIAVYPVVIAIFAFSNFSVLCRWLVLIYSAALCIPAFWLGESVKYAINTGAKSYITTTWQAYFGRFGPWMSNDTYLCAIAALAGFVSLLILLNLLHIKHRKLVTMTL